jgi:outer membrane protein OmpA-like peptidoglycan-associated protein
MSRTALISVLASSLVSAAALSGCLTPHAKPTLSQAVVQARAGAGAKPAACPSSDVSTVSPLEVAFGFDEATVPEVGHKRLADAARWLACNPQVEVVIRPDADRHGDAAHQNDLAQHRAQAVSADLRSLGAKDAVIHMLARGAADPVSAPHMVIAAKGRGW